MVSSELDNSSVLSPISSMAQAYISTSQRDSNKAQYHQSRLNIIDRSLSNLNLNEV